jgi:uncharacterized integral membrane protein (TIGR00698 family)
LERRRQATDIPENGILELDTRVQRNTVPHQADVIFAPSGIRAFTHYIGNLSWGVFLTIVIASAAFSIRSLPGLSAVSPMILAVIIGMAVNSVIGLPERARPGIAIVVRNVLRAAIILLGLQLTIGQVANVGVMGIGIIAGAVISTMGFTIWLGRVLRVDRQLSHLIAVGTAICGASAIVAANSVTRARGEDVAYALACITLFGTIAMFSYPLVAEILLLSPDVYGLWAGASIHEVAQVVAAAFQAGPEAGEIGTVAKLSRIIFLAPIVLSLAAIAPREGSGDAPIVPIPWFVFGFIGMMLLNSVVDVPGAVRSIAGSTTSFMLAMALAAMGLQTNIGQLRNKGLRPLLLGCGATLYIAGISLTLALLLV